MIGAAIGAAGALAGGIVNQIGNNQQGSKNRAHQLEMQRIQNEWASSESQNHVILLNQCLTLRTNGTLLKVNVHA